MKHLFYVLIAVATVALLAPVPRAHAGPKGGSGAEPAQRSPATETLSAESLLRRRSHCGSNHYPNLHDGRYGRAGAPADSLAPDEVTALALGALAVLAIAFVLVLSRTRKLQGQRRRQRRRAAAIASGT